MKPDTSAATGRIVELILVEFTRGNGTPDDVVRRVERYYRKNGELVFEIDSHKPEPKPDSGGA